MREGEEWEGGREVEREGKGDKGGGKEGERGREERKGEWCVLPVKKSSMMSVFY